MNLVLSLLGIPKEKKLLRYHKKKPRLLREHDFSFKSPLQEHIQTFIKGTRKKTVVSLSGIPIFPNTNPYLEYISLSYINISQLKYPYWDI